MGLAFSRTAFSSHNVTCVLELFHHLLIYSLLCIWCCAKCWGRSSGRISTSEASARWIPAKALLIPRVPSYLVLPIPHSFCPLSSHLSPREDPKEFIPRFCAFAFFCRRPPPRLSSLDPKVIQGDPISAPTSWRMAQKRQCWGPWKLCLNTFFLPGPRSSRWAQFPIWTFLFSPQFSFLWSRMLKRGK